MKNVILLKKILFVAIPAVISLILAICFPGAIYLGGIIAVIAFIRLGMAIEPIEDAFVRVGWALIMFSEFMLCMFISDSLWSLIIASILCILTYSFATVITNLMGLERCDGTNSVTFWILFFAFLIACFSFGDYLKEKDEKLSDEYAKSEFVKIEKIEKETYGGNTYFMVTTEKGELIGVDARKYPEIRHAAKGDEIKYTLDNFYNNGLKKVYKLMIR